MLIKFENLCKWENSWTEHCKNLPKLIQEKKKKENMNVFITI